jgi:ribosome-binding protein aMBF1 (putative translation factor)
MPVMTKTPKGDDIVILSRAEYDKLVATAHHNDDDADAATARTMLARLASGTEEVLTAAETDALVAAKTPLAFWRGKRGMTQTDLADRVGIKQGFLSEIESGHKTGDVVTLRKIANALRISLDDLVA